MPPQSMFNSVVRDATPEHDLVQQDNSDVSITLSIDELRWLHASETIVDSPTAPTEAGSSINANFIEGSNKTFSHANEGEDWNISTLGPNATRSNDSGKNNTPPPSSFKLKLAPTVVVESRPTLPSLRTQSLHRGRTWDRHRHYHLLDAPEIGMSLSTASSESGSGSGSSDVTPTPTITPTPRKASSSLIPAPIPIAISAKRSPTTPTSMSRSLPASFKPKSARTEWIYRCPKPRPVRAPPLKVSTSVSSSTTARGMGTTTNTRLCPPSPLSLSRTPSISSNSNSTSTSHYNSKVKPSPPSSLHSYHPPTYTRTRTRSSSSRSSPISITARTSPTALRPRVRPHAGYHAHHHHALSHANVNAAPKRPVHSVLPARPGSAKSAKDKAKEAKEREREGERSIWAMLRLGDKESVIKGKEKYVNGAREEDGHEEEGSPGRRILDIVNAAERESDRLRAQEIDKEKENSGRGKEKPRGVMKLKKGSGKGLALVIGRGRASPPATPAPHKRSASVTSTISTISAPILTSSSNPMPFIGTSQSSAQGQSLRNRASSASSNSTASTTSAHSASTAATSPSPSVPASPKPASTFNSSITFNPQSTSTPPQPMKGILSRSASTASRAPPQRPLAALLRSGSVSTSVSSSMKSVTFVEEPTVHYPIDYGVGTPESEHGHDGEGHGNTEHEEEHSAESDDHEDTPGTPYPSSEKKLSGKNALQALESSFTPSDLASGLSKGALAWEMGLDLDSMDLDLDLSLDLDVKPGVDLDAPLVLDIGQGYVAPPRERIGEIIEEEEEDSEVGEFGELPMQGLETREVQEVPKETKGLKRFFSLSRPAPTGGKTESKSIPIEKPTTNVTPSTRPAISGPFALGTLPVTGTSSSLPTRSLSPAGSSSASIRSQTRTRLGSNATTHTLSQPPRSRSPYSYTSLSAPSTPIHSKKHYMGTYPSFPSTRTSKTQRRRTAPAVSYVALNGNSSPISTTSSVGYSPSTRHTRSLRQVPSLESFRSAAGRSVRSLGSIKSTASVRGFRAWLGKVGIGGSTIEPLEE